MCYRSYIDISLDLMLGVPATKYNTRNHLQDFYLLDYPWSNKATGHTMYFD